MGLQIDWFAQLILITSPTVSVDMQVMHDFIEDEMASPVGMLNSAIIQPEGKIEDPVNPGIYSQIIIILNSPWQMQFWGSSGYTRLYGGKLVGGLSDQPMKATGTAGDITVLESPVDGLATQIETGTSGLTPAESQALLDIAANISTMQTDISTINTDIGTINASITLINTDISAMQGDISTLQVDVSNIAANIVTIDTNIGTITADIGDMQTALALIEAIERGEWKIENNQMIFYNLVSAEIARFNLFDKFGQPASEDVYRRVPV